MVELPDHITVDVTNLRPSLRQDLIITPQTFSGQPSFVIEEPLTGKFSRLGPVEYTFVSRLDGDTSIAAAMAATASIHGTHAIDENDAISICQWLIESGLANTTASRSGRRSVEAQQHRTKTAVRSIANPIFQRVPLGNPTRFLQPLTILARTLFSLPGFVVLVGLAFLATRSFLANLDDFMRSASNILAQDNWLHLIAAFVGLKLFHELGHALACRRYGGHVRECGVMFILFAPLPYVDVTSCWRLTNKWQRIVVAAAGMGVECALACVAIMVWCNTTDPLVQQSARNVIVSATITTLLFNLNPLMRFDGYYMLTDAIEMPNLATSGAKWFAAFRDKILVGSTAEPAVDWPVKKTWIVASYGICAAVWRIIVFVSLAIAAQHLFWGAGIVLAVCATVAWVTKPVLRWAKSWHDPSRFRKSHVGRIALASLAAILITACIPYHARVTAPVVIDYAETHEVRSQARGFLNRVLARPGQWITEGQPIATLDSPALNSDLRRIEVEIRQSKLRQRMFRNDNMTVALQVEQSNEASLLSRLSDLRSMTANLTITAPRDGRIVSTNLNDKVGTFVAAGEWIADIADDRKLVLKSMLNQKDAVRLADQQTLEAQVWIWGQGCLSDMINFTDLKPRASTVLPHSSFASICGGPLPVRKRDDPGGPEDHYELVEPHVLAEANLPTALSGNQREGQAGRITFRLRKQSILGVVTDAISDWWCRQLDAPTP